MRERIAQTEKDEKRGMKMYTIEVLDDYKTTSIRDRWRSRYADVVSAIESNRGKWIQVAARDYATARVISVHIRRCFPSYTLNIKMDNSSFVVRYKGDQWNETA